MTVGPKVKIYHHLNLIESSFLSLIISKFIYDVLAFYKTNSLEVMALFNTSNGLVRLDFRVNVKLYTPKAPG